MVINSRPKRGISPAKSCGAVGQTPVTVRIGSGHICRDISRSFRPPGCAGIEGRDTRIVTGVDYRVSLRLYKLRKLDTY